MQNGELTREEWIEHMPRKVRMLTYAGALLSGSQARRLVDRLPPDPSVDWDLMCPFAMWHRAALIVPLSSTLRPNGFRGWRFEEVYDLAPTGFATIDVWPDDLQRFLDQAVQDTEETVYAVSFRKNIIYTSQKKAWPQDE